MITFKPVRISTITCVSSVYDKTLDNRVVNISKLVDMIDLDDNFTAIKRFKKLKVSIKYSDQTFYKGLEWFMNPWFDANKPIDEEVKHGSKCMDGNTLHIYNAKGFSTYVIKRLTKSIQPITGVEYVFVDDYILKNPYHLGTQSGTIVQDAPFVHVEFRQLGANIEIKIYDNSVAYKELDADGNYHKVLFNVKNPRKKLSDFKNVFSVNITDSSGNRVDCKICSTGRVQLTGCKSEDQIDEILKIIETKFVEIERANRRSIFRMKTDKVELSDKICVPKHMLMESSKPMLFKGKNMISLVDVRDLDAGIYRELVEAVTKVKRRNLIAPFKIFSHPLKLDPPKIEMMMCHTKCSSLLDTTKMSAYITSHKRADIFSLLNTEKNKSLKIVYRTNNGTTIVYIIFMTGCINITKSRSRIQMMEGFKFITNLIKDNIDTFALRDMTHNIQSLMMAEGAPQGTQEWLDERKGRITASSVYDLVRKKEWMNPGVHNERMEHGRIFEPIAKKVYEALENADPDRAYKVYVHDMPLVKKGSRWGASPDGLVIKSRRQYASTEDIMADLDSDNKANILDACLLEIKCPSHYREIQDSLLAEAPWYYYQVQHQLYCTGLLYCIWMNCLFEHYENQDAFIADTTSPCKGIYARITFTDGTAVVRYTASGSVTNDDLSVTCRGLEAFCIVTYGARIEKLTIKYWKLVKVQMLEIDYDKDRYESEVLDKL